MRTYFLILILTISLQSILASPREASGEVVLDYVTELERTVDELLNKIVLLENEIDRLKEQNPQTKQEASENLNVSPEFNKRTSEDSADVQDRNKVATTISCPPCDVSSNQDNQREFMQTDQELNRLRDELEICENKLKTFTKENVISATPTEPLVNDEILKLRSVLASELHRFKQTLLNSDVFQADAKERQENLLKRVVEIETELNSASTYKHLADLKGRISSLKREFNSGFRSY